MRERKAASHKDSAKNPKRLGRANGPIVAPGLPPGITYNAGMPPVGSVREQAAEALGEARLRGLYDEDFWTWARQQAEALRRRDLAAVDWENLIEEVDDLGRSQERAWTSYCKNVLSHLLKIEHSESREACTHWRSEIWTWRDEMHDEHMENPGMKAKFPEMLAKAWRKGRRIAVNKLAGSGRLVRRQLRIWEARIPEECPYNLIDVIAYDPYQKRARLRNVLPERDVWPPDVARALNQDLGEDYPVRNRSREPDRG